MQSMYSSISGRHRSRTSKPNFSFAAFHSLCSSSTASRASRYGTLLFRFLVMVALSKGPSDGGGAGGGSGSGFSFALLKGGSTKKTMAGQALLAGFWKARDKGWVQKRAE